MNKVRIPIVENIMDANQQLANNNREIFTRNGVYTINIMASPGAGKTSLILKTIEELSSKYQIGVIEGDTAPVTIDADKISNLGMPAVQINTGGQCHLDALMVKNGMEQLSLDSLDLVIIENVGNLICPAGFDLGTHANIVVSSVPEGDDKPYKYPNIYRGLDVLVINKTDLIDFVEFDMDYFQKGVEILNPGLITFPISCRTGEGINSWIEWLSTQIVKTKNNK